ncbi:hypothetical protein [Streptomyces sp. Ncost-T10-10d]|uniref:HNH endonuclease n=1 Tax=Streptomyces sp. Ncost-T10-10d TaxID=1839774 RepID=UPI003520279F
MSNSDDDRPTATGARISVLGGALKGVHRQHRSRLAGRCDSCRRIDEVEVHHVAELADLGRPGNRPPWADLMAARHRKTLVA